MKAKVYILNPSSLHWYISEIFDNVDEELYKKLQAYAEYYQGQVSVEYNEA